MGANGCFIVFSKLVQMHVFSIGQGFLIFFDQVEIVKWI